MHPQKTIPNLVSVIIPCYNGERYIEETLQSVFNQTHSEIEIIVINDGSLDGTAGVVKKFMDRGVFYIEKSNSGNSDSRNKGFDYSRGEFIMFLDADDLIAPDFIEKRLEILQKNPEIGYCTGNIIKIDAHSEIIKKGFRGPSGDSKKIIDEIFSYNEEFIVCPSSFLFKRSLINQLHVRYNTRLEISQDRFYLLELATVTNGGFIENGAEMYYRIHSGGISQKITTRLTQDKRNYLRELSERNYIPAANQHQVLFKMYYILAGEFWYIGKYIDCVICGLVAFYHSPNGVFQKIIHKIFTQKNLTN